MIGRRLALALMAAATAVAVGSPLQEAAAGGGAVTFPGGLTETSCSFSATYTWTGFGGPVTAMANILELEGTTYVVVSTVTAKGIGRDGSLTVTYAGTETAGATNFYAFGALSRANRQISGSLTSTGRDSHFCT